MRDRLPSAMPDAAMTEHLEVLGRSRSHSRRIGQSRGEAGAMNRHLRNARDDLRCLDVKQIENRGREIDRVAELAANLAGRAKPGRPVNHQRVAHASAVSILLVPLERRVAGLRPSPGDIAVTVGAADVVETLERGVEVLRDSIEVAHLIEDADRTALLARAIVRHHDQQRIVEQIDLAEECDQPSDLLIGMLEHRRKRFLEPRGENPFPVGQVFPWAHARIVRREPGCARDDSDLFLAREPLLARRVPSGIESPAILFEIAAGRLMRRMGSAERQIQEERTLGDQRGRVADIANRTIDDVLGDVVAVRRTARRIDKVIVAGELGGELIGLALQEPVVSIEASLERPVLIRSGGGAFRHRREMPLAGGECGVAAVAQDFRERGGRAGNRAAHVRKSRIHVGYRAHPDRVMVAAGEKAGARGRAERGGMKPGETQSARRQPIDVGRLDRRAVASEVRKPGVIEHHDYDVGRSGRQFQIGPPGLRLARGPADDAPKLFA